MEAQTRPAEPVLIPIFCTTCASLVGEAVWKTLNGHPDAEELVEWECCRAFVHRFKPQARDV